MLDSRFMIQELFGYIPIQFIYHVSCIIHQNLVLKSICMFRTYNLNNNQLSIKNLILLFLTIIMGFASVITLAQISIPSDIENAWQTIKRVTITDDGTNNGTTLWDFNDGIGTYVTGLDNTGDFSWRVLGIDDNGYLIYAYSEHLVVSWVGGGWGEYRTGVWSDIWDLNNGNVGIGAQPMSGKLHITNSWSTELYIEETNPNNAANINFKNTVNTRMLWGFSWRFYIWLNGTSFFSITSDGKVGIGTPSPSSNFQVSGTFIAGNTTNSIADDAYNASIWWGTGNRVRDFSSNASIWWGEWNQIFAASHSFIGGGLWNTINIIAPFNINIYSSIVGWTTNTITNSTTAAIVILIKYITHLMRRSEHDIMIHPSSYRRRSKQRDYFII